MKGGRFYKARGFILKVKPVGERDRLVCLLTPERGKLSCVAPGARKTKSSLAALVEPFTYGVYLLYRGKNLYTISQAEKITTFHSLRNSLEAYTLACHLCQLVCEVVEEEGGENKELFNLLLKSMNSLEKGAEPALVALAFQFKLLSVLGYAPQLAGCLYCGQEAAYYYVSLREGGVVCPRCRPEKSPQKGLTRGSLALARHLIKGEWPVISRIKMTEEQYAQLSFFSQTFLQYWAGVENFQALRFLEKINRC